MFRNWKIKILFIALGGFIVLFIVAPIIGIYLKTSFEDYSFTIADEQVRRSIGLTLYASMVGTVLFGIGAIPLAYILARKSFPLKEIVNGIIDLPVIIPHSAAGIALLGVISRNTLVGQAGESVEISFVDGIADGTIDLETKVTGILPVEHGGTEGVYLKDGGLLIGGDEEPVRALPVQTMLKLL